MGQIRDTGKFVLLVIIFLIPHSFFAQSKSAAQTNKLFSPSDSKGFTEDKYDKLLKKYNQELIKNPDSPIANYNIGCIQYKKGDYQRTVDSFNNALLTDDKALLKQAYYNLGNAKFKLGKTKENTDLRGAVQLHKEALEYYKKAIEIDSKDKDAKFNHEFTERHLKELLDRLKNQPQEKEQDKQSEQKQEQPEQTCPLPEKQEDKGREGTKNEGRGTRDEGEEDKKKEELKKEGEEKEDNEQAGASQEKEVKPMTKEEANMLLDKFFEDEKQGRELRDTEQRRESGVEKDW